MKKFPVIVVMLLCLTLAAPLFAQSTLQSNVPFDFYFGKQLLPAGHYSIAFDQSSRMVMLYDSHGHRFTATGRIEPLSEPLAGAKLVFVESNGTHYLSQFGMPGESSVTQLSVNEKMTGADASLKKVELDMHKNRK